MAGGPRGVVVSIIGVVVGFPVKIGQAVGDVYYARKYMCGSHARTDTGAL